MMIFPSLDSSWLCSVEYLGLRNICVPQQEKVYVQHRVTENAQLLWDLITKKKGCFYIAG